MRQNKKQKKREKRTESQQSKMTASALLINTIKESRFAIIEVCGLLYQEI